MQASNNSSVGGGTFFFIDSLVFNCQYLSGRGGSLMVSALDSGSGGASSSPGMAGALRCVLLQDTLLS